MSSSGVFYERIFTTSELVCMEQQISHLIAKMKELKAYCKEELKKIQLRLEKEIMDASQSGKTDLVQLYTNCQFILTYACRIEKTNEIIKTHVKSIDEEIDKDTTMMDQKLNELKELRYDNDFWKELELKALVGEHIDPIEEYQANVDEYVKLIIDEFNSKIRKIRNMIDQEDFRQIQLYLTELLAEVSIPRPSTPRSPGPDEKSFWRTLEDGKQLEFE